MKKFLIFGVVAALAVLSVFGFEKTWSYVRGGRTLVNEELVDKTPLKLEAARLHALLDSEAEKIAEYEDLVADLESRDQAAARTASDLEHRLAGQSEILRKARSMLAVRQASYVIAGRNYSSAEVSRDAVSRLELCQQLRQQAEFQDSLHNDLEKAVTQGHATLVDARHHYDELKNALARLELRDDNAEARTQVAQLAAALHGSPLGPTSELEKGFQNYERRVVRKEREAVNAGSGGNPALIDYSSSAATDAVTQIDGFFNTSVPHATAADGLGDRATDAAQKLPATRPSDSSETVQAE